MRHPRGCHESQRTADADPLATLPVEDVLAMQESSIGSGYELLGLLGQGGVGEVHAARQRSLGRTVAVKTMRRGPDGGLGGTCAAEIARFRAEAVVTALLEHPNIVPVHDLAAAGDGTLLLAMKRIEGATWRALLHPRTRVERERAAGRTLEDELGVLLKVCDGMAFAHACGVVHADLKPDNIMIGDFGEVLIADWGCAVAIASDLPALIPRPGTLQSLRGTPAYMAPEVATGQVRRIAPATDIFLLGATLYELLTGTPPYQGCQLEAVLAEATVATIEPPERRAPQREMPQELCRLALDAMSLEPGARPQSVRSFAARLGDYRRHAAANELAEAAKQQLRLARDAGEDGDEHFRRAIAYCERGIDIWPERQVGRDQLAEVQIEYAVFALGTQAFHLAHAQARSASNHARSSGRLDLMHRAEDTARAAERASTSERRRLRQFALLRLGLTAVMLTLVLALLAGLLINLQHDRQQLRTEQLDEQATAVAEEDRAAAHNRLLLLRGLDGRFLAQAIQAGREERWQLAADDAAVVLASDPHQRQAWRVRTVALALGGRMAEALDTMRQWRRLDPQHVDLRITATLARLQGDSGPASRNALRQQLED